MAATDPNSSTLSISGTPLKAIDNICSSTRASGPPSDSLHTGVHNESLFVRPQLTSTPAATRRNSPKKVVPLMELNPVKRSTLFAGMDGGSFSQDGGFLAESQSIHSTPVFPNMRPPRRGVFDDDVTELEFRPVLVSTQMCAAEPVVNGNAGNHRSKLGQFENSFADVDASDATITQSMFKPLAASTQASPKPLNSVNRLSELCPRTDKFEHSCTGESLTHGMPENGGMDVMEVDLVSVTSTKIKDGVLSPMTAHVLRMPENGRGSTMETGLVSVTSTKVKDGVLSPASVHEVSQQMRSRSPSPELFDCDDGLAKKVLEGLLPHGAGSSSTTQTDMRQYVVTSLDENKTTSFIHQAAAPHATLAQKLANKKLKAEDGIADEHGPCNADPVVKSSLIRQSGGSLVKENDMKCTNDKSGTIDKSYSTQTRRSARLSTRTKRSLHCGKVRRRGVDFLDEIDEVFYSVSFLVYYTPSQKNAPTLKLYRL